MSGALLRYSQPLIFFKERRNLNEFVGEGFPLLSEEGWLRGQ
jgi:hypothetical protein